MNEKPYSFMEELQNEILDEYNKGNISKKEANNIMQWTIKIIDAKQKHPNNNTILMDVNLKNEK